MRARCLQAIAGSSLALAAAMLPGCVGVRHERIAPGEEPQLVGPAVRDNRTPMDPVFACFAPVLASPGTKRLVIAVGDVRDFTGKYSVGEGTAITQGGSLMVASALGKLGTSVALAERFDPTIGERELGYTDRRQLGDGKSHPVDGAPVPWLPYYGGSITASDYYIVGGITELNYNIRSGGAEARVGQVGPNARTYTQSVAIDLRIVDTRSLLVVRTISLTKQYTGYEVGFNTFRFFGSQLFDVNIGAKAQEPLQLAIRTALEEATLRLVAAAAAKDAAACLATRSWDAVPAASPMDAVAAAPPAATGGPVPSESGTADRPRHETVTLAFEPDSDRLTVAAASQLNRIASAGRSHPLDLVLTAPDTEPTDPRGRDGLTEQRIATVALRLRAMGLRGAALLLSWRPAPGDTRLYPDAAGFQRVARLQVAD